MLALLLAIVLTVEAPPPLASAAARIRAIDQKTLANTLVRAGLDLPARAHVTLIPEDDPRARATPPWMVARASGAQDIIIFPARTSRYPYDSLESVMRHEVVHLALFQSAGGRPVPRWFHEGVATSVEAGWGTTDDVRLMVASLRDPAIADLGRLFQSEAQPDTTLAYLLAAGLVEDLRQRHGSVLPGRVATHVARGIPFAQAFELETGETPDAAAARAWSAYRRWTTWLPAITSGSSIWAGILVLAFAAFVVNRIRRARRRRRWGEEATDGSAGASRDSSRL